MMRLQVDRSTIQPVFKTRPHRIRRGIAPWHRCNCEMDRHIASLSVLRAHVVVTIFSQDGFGRWPGVDSGQVLGCFRVSKMGVKHTRIALFGTYANSELQYC